MSTREDDLAAAKGRTSRTEQRFYPFVRKGLMNKKCSNGGSGPKTCTIFVFRTNKSRKSVSGCLSRASIKMWHQAIDAMRPDGRSVVEQIGSTPDLAGTRLAPSPHEPGSGPTPASRHLDLPIPISIARRTRMASGLHQEQPSPTPIKTKTKTAIANVFLSIPLSISRDAASRPRPDPSPGTRPEEACPTLAQANDAHSTS